MRRPRDRNGLPDPNRLARLVGILGVVVGTMLLIGTASGTINKGPALNGYLLGAGVLAYGFFRLWGGRK